MEVFGLTGALISVAICAYAYGRGERPEKIGAVTLGLAVLVTPIVQDRTDWLDTSFRLGLIDLMLFSALAYLTITTHRVWVLYAAALQILAVGADALHLCDPRVGGRAYLTVGMALGYGVDFALLAGAVQVARARNAEIDQEADARVERALAYFGDPFDAYRAAHREIARSRGRDLAIAHAVARKLADRMYPPSNLHHDQTW